MPSGVTWTYSDWGNERSSFDVYTATINAASMAGITAALATLKSEVEGITIGESHKEALFVRSLLSNDPASSESAQRERKWLVTYKGNTTEKLFRVEIPCADPTGRLLPLSDLADPDNADVAAFIAAFEAVAKSPDDGAEGVTVQSVRLVGRNI